jgi:8-oxo-dGTP pyrophosphatase MutT (NUDIX family)
MCDADGADAMLRLLVQRLAARGEPRLIAAPRRAAVALLLRRRSAASGGGGGSGAGGGAADELELLFILRPDSPRDPWSGQVAFAGGKQDAADGGSDLATALRECREELGLDLLAPAVPMAPSPLGAAAAELGLGGAGADGGAGATPAAPMSAASPPASAAAAFELLGRLDDAPIYAGGRRREGAAYCAFVFLQRAAQTPPLSLQPGEVAAARWVPLRHFARADAVSRFALARDGYSLFPTSSAWPRWLRAALGVERAYFNSVLLPAGAAAPGPEMRLWGMSLRATSELCELCGVRGARALALPPARFDNALVNAAAEAAAALAEAAAVARAGRPWGEASGGARAAAAAAVAVALAAGALAFARMRTSPKLMST